MLMIFLEALCCMELPAAAEEAVNTPSKTKVTGRWLGSFRHPAYVFDADMQLQEDASGIISGVIVWCMRKAPGEKHKSKIGLTAKEFIAGRFDRKSKTVALKTKRIEDPHGLGIDPDEYSLKLSADGNTLAGGTAAHQDGLGRFNARRAAHDPGSSSK